MKSRAALLAVLLGLPGCMPARDSRPDVRPPAPGSAPPADSVPGPVSTRPDFEADVRPILEARCRPCHFEGGKMYDRLPFDRAETVLELGEKLFTRIEEESDRAVIRSFLREPHPEADAAGDP